MSDNPIVVTRSSLKPFFFNGLQGGGTLLRPWWSIRPWNPIRASPGSPCSPTSMSAASWSPRRRLCLRVLHWCAPAFGRCNALRAQAFPGVPSPSQTPRAGPRAHLREALDHDPAMPPTRLVIDPPLGGPCVAREPLRMCPTERGRLGLPWGEDAHDIAGWPETRKVVITPGGTAWCPCPQTLERCVHRRGGEQVSPCLMQIVPESRRHNGVSCELGNRPGGQWLGRASGEVS